VASDPVAFKEAWSSAAARAKPALRKPTARARTIHVPDLPMTQG
jgi:hypothetical protein